MRVIAGRYRSRPLASLRGLDLRPTADRLRETLFNVLTAGNPAALAGAVWLDLYAGSGAVGIEALSRGASQVFFAESSARAADLVKKNLEALGIKTGFEIIRQDVARALVKLASSGITSHVVFLDPPYRLEKAYRQTLQTLGQGQGQLLDKNSVVIAEHERRFDPGGEFGRLKRSRKLEQGDAALSFYGLD